MLSIFFEYLAGFFLLLSVLFVIFVLTMEKIMVM